MDNRTSRNAAIFGVILITIGVVTLFGQFFGNSPLWGAALTLLLGLVFFAGAYLSGRTLNILAIPGVVLVCVGVFKFIDLYFPLLNSGIYAWALVIAAIGLGMVAFGRLTDSPDLERSGWSVAQAGLVFFLVVGIAIELLFTFTGGSSGPRTVIWPLILIATGVLTLIVRLVRLAQAGTLLGGTPTLAAEMPEEPEVVVEPASEGDESTSDAISRAEARARRAVRRAQRRVERHNTDLFSPVVWIGFGILWLQLSLNMISFNNLMSLVNLWPVLLVFAGVNIIFGRRQPIVNLLLALVLVAGAFYAATNAERLGLTGRSPWLTFGINVNGGQAITERVTGSRTITTENRPVSDFHGIVINGAGDISIVKGSSAALSIETDDNVQPYLTSEVRDGQLYLGIKPGVSVSPTRLHYTITVNSLDNLVVNGAANVTADPLSGDTLSLRISGFATVDMPNQEFDSIQVSLSGSGSITLSGAASDLQAQISGAGSFNGGELRTKESLVQISGVGQATVWATERLNSNISGLGSVAYFGSPTVNKTQGGLGLVRSLGEK